MKTKADVLSIIAELKKLYPDGICSLDYPKPYELLFSVRLAAQCTDERVNMVTPALFARFPTLESLAEADISEVETYIHSTGFFRAKARDIVGAARMMLDEYGGKVPDNMDDLLKKDRQSDPGRRLSSAGRGGGGYPLYPHFRQAGPDGRHQRPGQSGNAAPQSAPSRRVQ